MRPDPFEPAAVADDRHVSRGNRLLVDGGGSDDARVQRVGETAYGVRIVGEDEDGRILARHGVHYVPACFSGPT